jgi:hypothetical protein
MIPQRKTNLKAKKNHKLLVGKTLDEALAIICKNAYACHVFYDDTPIESMGKDSISIEVNKNNEVTKVI